MLPTATDRLLLCCLGGESDASKAARLQGLSAADWEKVFFRSVNCGVTPLLYQRLRSLHPLVSIPEEIWANLKRTYLASAGRNTLLYHQLGQVLEALREDQIPGLALKGVHLAQMVYGDIALRPMGDIDLLIRKCDLPRVEKKLGELEYHISGVRELQENFSHELTFQPSRRGTRVDVHWALLEPDSPLTLDTAGLWQRARPATLAGVKVKVLAPTDLLLYACLHTSFCDRFPGIKPLCDLVEIVGYYRQEMDWDQVVRRAHQWQASRFIFLTLYLTKRLLAAGVPDTVLDKLRPDDFNGEVYRWALDQTLGEKTDVSTFPVNLLQLWRPGQVWPKVSLLFKRIFLPLESLPSNPPLSPDLRRLRIYLRRLKFLLQNHSLAALAIAINYKKLMPVIRRETALRNWLIGIKSR